MPVAGQTTLFVVVSFTSGLILNSLLTTLSYDPFNPKAKSPEGQCESVPTSHEALNRLSTPTTVREFKDSLKHNDNTNIADELRKKVRVLCWVTSSQNTRKKAEVVVSTWGKRIDVLIFFTDAEDDMNSTLPLVKLNISHGRDHLTGKTMAAFDHIYQNHLDDADWFMKADDDTYVVAENLRYFLADQSTKDPIYFGHHFSTIVKQGYPSGGGGYVVSKEALRRFGQRSEGLCRNDGGPEDASFGSCMEKLKVPLGDSRDSLGRSRFHCFDPQTFIDGNYPEWYLSYDKYGAPKGNQALSDYAVTFHYISSGKMQLLEYLIYHLRPYGILGGIQDLNRHKTPAPLLQSETSANATNQTISQSNTTKA